MSQALRQGAPFKKLKGAKGLGYRGSEREVGKGAAKVRGLWLRACGFPSLVRVTVSRHLLTKGRVGTPLRVCPHY